MNNWKKVFATHEEPQILSSGIFMPVSFPGVALPSAKSLYKWIKIRYKSLWTCAMVFDVGPWCVDDDSYVFGSDKPRAERHKGNYCPLYAFESETNGLVCNGAGIDLFPETARNLGIPINENVELEWCFVEP